MRHRFPWSKRSLAAQAMGACRPDHQGGRAADPSSRRPISATRTTPIRRASSTAGPTTPRCREAESVLAMLEEARPGRCCSPPAWRRRPRCSRRSTPATTSSRSQGDVLGPAQLARHGGRCAGACASTSSRPTISTALRKRRCGRARPSSSGSRRPRTRSGPSPTSPARPRSRIAAGARLAVDSDRRLAGPYAPAGARRRHRHACRDEGPERPFRRGRRRARRRDGRTRSGRGSSPSARARARSSGPSRPIC